LAEQAICLDVCAINVGNPTVREDIS
jgi:hypothetical protein